MTSALSNGREVAHDVNGLTASLILSSHRLEMHDDHAVVAEARRLKEVTGRILEICQAELRSELIPEPHSLDCLTRILSDIDLALAPSRSAAGVPYSIHLQTEGLISFDCSAPMLFRVLYNLISNAANAIRDTVEPRIDVFATQHAGRLYVQVADNGPGISPMVREWFFAGANRAARNDDLVGTGLLSVEKLLSRSGGTLKLIYSGDEGSRIGFCLPVVPDARIRTVQTAFSVQQVQPGER